MSTKRREEKLMFSGIFLLGTCIFIQFSFVFVVFVPTRFHITSYHFYIHFQDRFLLLVLKAVHRLTIVNAKQSANSLAKWCPAATAEAYKTPNTTIACLSAPSTTQETTYQSSWFSGYPQSYPPKALTSKIFREMFFLFFYFLLRNRVSYGKQYQ